MTDQNTRSLTEGSPFRVLLSFTLPLLLGLIFQQLYSMIDTIVVGKYLGVEALAGVGSTGAICFLVLGFCSGICSGFVIPVAQKFGQKNYQALRRIVGNILWLTIGCSVLITTIVCLLCTRILVWMHTPENVFGYAYTYIFIMFLGIPSMLLYNILSGIIRSLGNSKIPLYFLVFSSILNIILDLILILWVHMGVAGAAWATVISQIVSGVLCFIYMCRSYPILHLQKEELRPRGHELRLLLSMGLPMGLQYTITAVGCTILQTAVNMLGATAMATITACNRVQCLLMTPFEAIGTAAATYTGQNVGAGNLDRVHCGTRVSFLLGTAYSFLAVCVVWLWSDFLLMLFLDPAETHTAQILAGGRQFLTVNSLNYVFLLMVNLLRFSIQGMGYSNLAIIAGVLELVARAFLALILVPVFGFSAVCFTNPAAWILADVFLIPMYFIGLKALKSRSAS